MGVSSSEHGGIYGGLVMVNDDWFSWWWIVIHLVIWGFPARKMELPQERWFAEEHPNLKWNENGPGGSPSWRNGNHHHENHFIIIKPPFLPSLIIIKPSLIIINLLGGFKCRIPKSSHDLDDFGVPRFLHSWKPPSGGGAINWFICKYLKKLECHGWSSSYPWTSGHFLKWRYP